MRGDATLDLRTMGDHEIEDGANREGLRAFVRALLEDLRALERMLEEGWIESGVRRIGAEQEVFLVDAALQPAPVAMEVLARLEGQPFTTELGLFNLELNLAPKKFEGDCLARTEQELLRGLDAIRAACAPSDARPVLAGILPTLEKRHLGLEYMTPLPRYAELNRVTSELRGGEFVTLIKGLDELETSHPNVMLEACNTSFQIHFQVGAEEFAPLYNLAQLVTAPVLACAVNSPVLLQHRLWQETRVALFQQSLDLRSRAQTARGQRQRVSFGERWIDKSVLEIHREDVARYRVLIAGELDEPPMDVLDRGEAPRLRALCLHNGTVYRWNRPCYGVYKGRAHLRIENRALPAGPTVLDEVANAAFYFGLMTSLGEAYGDVTRLLPFEAAKQNFSAAARYGLEANLRWVDGRTVPASTLISEQLLPLARRGLTERGLDAADIDRYLGVVEERVASGRTGARWALDSLAELRAENPGTRHRLLVRAMLDHQTRNEPVHTWPLAPAEGDDWRHGFASVRQVMQSDLFTVGPEDLVDLAANLMDWEHLRQVPVEDSQGRLVGLVSHRTILRTFASRLAAGDRRPIAVREIMRADPVSIEPEASVLDAIERMREHRVSCLPVVEDGRLVGIVTEHDFIRVAGWLLERALREGVSTKPGGAAPEARR